MSNSTQYSYSFASKFLVGALMFLAIGCSDNPSTPDHFSKAHNSLVGGIQPELTYICPNAFNTSNANFVDSFLIRTEESTPLGMAFSHDGTKLYIIGSNGDDINEYDLATAFDVSTGVFNHAFSIAAQETLPTDLALSPDGTKLYIIGATGDDINEYDLTTPCDVSTGVFVDSFSVAAQDTVPTALAFNNDGTKIYVLGRTGDDVNEYDLGTSYDVSTAVYLQNFSVAAQEISPSGMSFNHDGTKMYVTGYTGDDINEYQLSSAWDVSTAVFVDVFAGIGQESAPRAVEFNNDGTKVYLLGTTGDDVNEYDIIAFDYNENSADDGSINNSDPLQITLTGDTFQDTDNDNILDIGTEVTIGNVPTGLLPLVTLSNGDTTATLTFTGTAANNKDADDVASLTFEFTDAAFTTLTAAAVNNSGNGSPYDTKIGIDFFEVRQCLTYIGPDSFDVTTAVFTDTLPVATQELNPEGLVFSSDGTRVYITGFSGDDINQYTLATPWDVSTGVFDYKYAVNAQEAIPSGLTFSPDGTKLYLIGWSGDDVNEYNVLAPWDIRSLEFVQNFSVSAQDGIPGDVEFSPDGTTMYVIGRLGDAVYEYALGTPWDVSTAAYVDSLNVAAEHLNPTGITFNNHGDKLYVIGISSDSVTEYLLSTPWDVSTGIVSKSITIVAQEATAGDVAFNPEGTKMYVIGRAGDDINEYSIDLGDYVEDTTGGGVIDPMTFLCVELGGDVFQDADNDNLLDVGSEVTIGNIPPGLTPVMTLSDGDTKVTLTFTGAATNHAETDDVANLTFSFDDSAFETLNASEIKQTGDGVPYDSDVGIDFTDVCGDGVILAPEVCDDGNALNGDGCDNLCQVEAGWTCDGLNPTTCTNNCGDGILTLGVEQCDDGGSAPGDGCDGSCQIEAGYTCDGLSPTTCALGVVEFCNNGIDDDNDSLVDEWDVGDCPCTPGGPINSCPITCSYSAPAEPYVPQAVWSGQFVDSRETPLVGDVDGDGEPEVVVDNYQNPGIIYILNGITGATEHTIPTGRDLTQNNSSNAIADIDRDGKAEIYFIDDDRRLNRLVFNNGFGTWVLDYTSTDLLDSDLFVPGLADFNGDGIAEVFAGNQIFDAATGALLLDAVVTDADPGGSVAIDMLPDAFCANCQGLELVTANRVWSVDIAGSTITEEVALTSAGTARGPTSVADVDNDGDYDIAYTANVGGLGSLVVWDGQTDTLLMPIFPAPPSGGSTSTAGGRPNIADFDNDGVLEFGFVAFEIYVVVDDVFAAGAPVAMWSAVHTDGSSRTGSTVFDFENDGQAEVVYRDENDLYIYEGATGNILMVTPCTSGTRFEYPVVADVNLDGQSEVIVTCDNLGLTAFNSNGTPWAGSRSVWNQHAYNVTNITDDLFVPSVPANNMTGFGGAFDNFLVQSPIVDAAGNAQFPAPDASITTIAGVHTSTCPDLEVTYTIQNTGDEVVPTNTPISFYDADPITTAANVLATSFTTGPVAPGASVTFTATISVSGPLLVWAMINDAGTTPTPFDPTMELPNTTTGECDFSNQQSRFRVITCPECGNGLLDQMSEVCDDGNVATGDGCDGICLVETGWTCDTSEPSVCTTTCGDGIVAGTEICDDGNTIPGDGCDAACEVETGWTCDGADPTDCAPICGDGLIRGSEVCDDADTDNDDGCDDTCQVEPGWTCDGLEPTTCTSVCGDGITTPVEECDDNNTTDNDGCTNCLEDPTADCVETPPGGTSVCTFPPSMLRVSKLEKTADNQNIRIGLTASYDVSDVFIEWSRDWNGPFTRASQKPLPAIGLGTTYTEKIPEDVQFGRVVEVSEAGKSRVVSSFDKSTMPISLHSSTPGSIEVTRSYGMSFLNVDSLTSKTKTRSKIYKDTDTLLLAVYSSSIHGVGYQDLEDLTGVDSLVWSQDCKADLLSFTRHAKDLPFSCQDDGVLFYPGNVEFIFDKNQFASLKKTPATGQSQIGTLQSSMTTKSAALFQSSNILEENVFPVTAAEPDPSNDLYFWEVLSDWSDSSDSFVIPWEEETAVESLTLHGFAYGEDATIALYNGEEKLMEGTARANESSPVRFDLNELELDQVLSLKVLQGTYFVDRINLATQNDSPSSLAKSLAIKSGQAHSSVLWQLDKDGNVTRLLSHLGGIEVQKGNHYIEEDITWTNAQLAKELSVGINPKDIVLVYHQAFEQQVREYSFLHSDLSFEFLKTEDIYGAYGDGSHNPNAIKAAIAELSKKQKREPKVVVLFGDGHLDYRDISGNKANNIPPLLEKTGYGLYPNDSLFAPKSVVARLPFADANEADRYLKRLKEHLSGKHPRQNNKLLIYGTGATDFERQMDLATGGNASFLMTEASSDSPADFVASMNEFNEAIYLGHAGLTDLGESSWLSAGDFAPLEIPIWFGGTCLVNAFSYPGDIESFGENMLRNANALVSIAPTSPKRTDQNLAATIEWNTRSSANELIYEKFAQSQTLKSNMAILGDPLLPLSIQSKTEDSEPPREVNAIAQENRGGCSNGDSQSTLFGILFVLGVFFRKRRYLPNE